MTEQEIRGYEIDQTLTGNIPKFRPKCLLSSVHHNQSLKRWVVRVYFSLCLSFIIIDQSQLKVR